MAVPDALQAHSRTAWRPIIAEGDGPPDASKIAGTPWIPTGEARPACGHCGRPLQLFLQLNTADLPEGVRHTYGDGRIQLFYCTNWESECEVQCEAFFPFAASVVARLIPLGGDAATTVDPVTSPLSPRRIVGWEAMEDVPNTEEAEFHLGVELSEDEREAAWTSGLPAEGDKLGGWPAWVQGVEYPACPRCGQSMQLVFQLDSGDYDHAVRDGRFLDYGFGDAGIAHLTQCPAHKDVLAFGWACG